MKINLSMILTLIFLCFCNVSAQSSQDLTLEKGVAAHARIDDVYRRFSEGYRKLDSEAVTNLYTDDAFYLAPGDDVRRGREKVLATFARYFDSIRKAGGSLTISFQILDRGVSGDLAYDVGIYTVTEKDSKGEARGVGRGKFVVVAKRMTNGDWRFHIDSYSDLPKVQKNPSGDAQKQESPFAAIF